MNQLTDIINEKDLDLFHDMLFDMTGKSYQFSEMVTILKYMPLSYVQEALENGFDTQSCDALHEWLKNDRYKDLLNNPARYSIP